MTIKWTWGALLAVAGGCQQSLSLKVESTAEASPLASTAQAEAAACTLTAPVVVATTPTPVFGNLEVDDQYVYYMVTNPEEDFLTDLSRIDKNGEGAPQLIARHGTSVGGLNLFQYTVNPTGIYVMYAGSSDIPSQSGGVWRYGKELLDHQLVSAGGQGGCYAYFVLNFAVAPNGTLWWEQVAAPRFTGETFAPFTNGCEDARNFTLVRVGVGEAKPLILRRTDEVDPFEDLHADNDHVFWKSAEGIFRMSQLGGPETVETLLSTQPVNGRDAVTSFTIDSTSVYWRNEGDVPANLGSVNRITAPGQSEQIFPQDMVGLLSDGENLFGTVFRPAGPPALVTRLKPNGHGKQTLAKGAIGSVAVDDTFVYFLDTSRTKIMKACKEVQ